ncbi:hypothetical protein ACFL6B_06565, partial [Thermodesulfobacteriota bacterium]
METAINEQTQKMKIKTESFERFESFFHNDVSELSWKCLFALPVWLKTWWDTFGDSSGPEIITGYRGEKLIGI